MQHTIDTIVTRRDTFKGDIIAHMPAAPTSNALIPNSTPRLVLSDGILKQPIEGIHDIILISIENRFLD
jgi:hypothetical protein